MKRESLFDRIVGTIFDEYCYKDPKMSFLRWLLFEPRYRFFTTLGEILAFVVLLIVMALLVIDLRGRR